MTRISRFFVCTRLIKTFNEEHERLNILFNEIGHPSHLGKIDQLLVREGFEVGWAEWLLPQLGLPLDLLRVVSEAEFGTVSSEGDRFLVVSFDPANPGTHPMVFDARYSAESAQFCRKHGDNGRFLTSHPATVRQASQEEVEAKFARMSPETQEKINLEAIRARLTTTMVVEPLKPDPRRAFIGAGFDELPLEDQLENLKQIEAAHAQAVADGNSQRALQLSQTLVARRGH